MSRSVRIAGREIGPGAPPFIVAEMSGNHNGSLDRAMAIVDAAADAGAHAVKLQTYTAETMTLRIADAEFFISDSESPWRGKSLYDLYEEAHTRWAWHEPIFRRCRQRGLIGFSTAYDQTAIEFLEGLDVPCYKIASFENTDLRLIRAAAATEKPLIISTGLASVAELDETVRAARDAGCRDLILMKCTSAYPADPDSTNLRTIPHLAQLFDCVVGLSDHTLGIGVGLAAIGLGVAAIEKHLTLRRADGGVDAAFSLEPHELHDLAKDSERAWRALGRVVYGPTESERPSMIFRRSLYVAEDMREGDVFTERNLRAVRPGFGLPPKYYEALLGKRVRHDVKRGTRVTWDLIE